MHTMHQVELAQQDGGSGATVEELRLQLDTEPLSHATRLELAQMLMQRDDSESAVDATRLQPHIQPSKPEAGPSAVLSPKAWP